MSIRLDGLRLQLLGLFVLPVTLIVVAVAVLAVGIHRDAMRQLVAERDVRAASAAAIAVNEALEAKFALLEAFLAGQDAAASARQLSEPPYPDAFPLGLGLYDQGGALLEGRDVLAEFGASNPISAGGEAGRFAVGFETEEETAVLLGLSLPPLTVVGGVPIRNIVPVAIQTRPAAQAGASIYLVGPQGDLLFAIGGPVPPGLATHAAVQDALRGERGASFLPMEDGEHVVAFAPVANANWGLIVEESWENVSSSLLDLSLLAPLSLVPILALALIGLWFGARRVIQPLRRLEEAAADLPDGEAGAIEKPTGGIAEIEQLRATLARMSRRVRQAQAALRAYIGVITNAQEEERRRIARELHDESVQHWIALDQQLQLAASRIKEHGSLQADTLEQLHQQAQAGIKELRRLSRGLRPIYLEDLGLVPAIEMLVRDLETGLAHPIHFQIEGEATRLTPEAELAVYRVVQEGLSNITRHAKASSAQVTLRFRPGSLVALVEDNGIGFTPPDRLDTLAAAGHYGMLGMKERADALGGRFEIESASGEGARIRLTVPIPPRQS